MMLRDIFILLSLSSTLGRSLITNSAETSLREIAVVPLERKGQEPSLLEARIKIQLIKDIWNMFSIYVLSILFQICQKHIRVGRTDSVAQPDPSQSSPWLAHAYTRTRITVTFIQKKNSGKPEEE